MVVDEATWMALDPPPIDMTRDPAVDEPEVPLMPSEEGPFEAEIDVLPDLARALGGVDGSSPDDLSTRITQVVADDSCDRTVAPTPWRSLDPVIIHVELRTSCDASSSGANFTVTLRPKADGTWTIVAATSRKLCSREITTEGLCN